MEIAELYRDDAGRWEVLVRSDDAEITLLQPVAVEQEEPGIIPEREAGTTLHANGWHPAGDTWVWNGGAFSLTALATRSPNDD